MTALGAISAADIRPERLIAAERVVAILAMLSPETAAELATVEPLALEAYAAKREQVSPDQARFAVRDEAIRSLAAAGMSAADIEREMARYEASAWCRDRLVDDMPARYAGRPQAMFWLAFKCNPVGLKRRRIAQLIENVESSWQSEPPSDCQGVGR